MVEGIGTDHPLSRRSYGDYRTVIGEGTAHILIVGGTDTHYLAVPRGVYHNGLSVIPCRSDHDHAFGTGIIDRLGQFLRGAAKAKAHIDHLGAVIHRVIDSADDQGERGSAVAAEHFHRHELGRGCHQVDQTGNHGSMVAGLIHLVAPTAKLMPVKVFSSDGTSTLSLIISGIYYAVDHGAKVINMSFSFSGTSPELTKAIDYASSQRVIMVASAGNDGQSVVIYPAGYSQVMGIGSTNNQDVRSSFSNYGSVVTIAAPGEGMISTYPFNHYAAGWGTSFSTPLVSGAAALLVDINSNITEAQAQQALSQAVPIGQGMGVGRLDLVQACQAVRGH